MLIQGGSGGSGENWLDFGLKVEPIGLLTGEMQTGGSG